MSLWTKYRPDTFDGVIGQKETVAALRAAIKRRSGHAFLLHGPSGTGKTTCARICAAELNAEPLEIDGATYTGIDDMRRIQDVLQYRSFGKGGSRAIIIDECHRLSAQAWDSLLKAIEEPPEHVFWFLCTTEPEKLRRTIKTRCLAFEFRLVNERELGEFYDGVCDAEKLDIPGDVGDLIIHMAGGSPRQLLVNLELARDATGKHQAAKLLQTAVGSEPVVDLCKVLTKGGGSWPTVMKIVERLDGESSEGVRIVVLNWMKSALRRATKENEIKHFLWVMQQFETPFVGSTADAQLIQAIGRVLYAE